jgi:TPP-dependent 2-oxoacid decarboxylase
MVEPLPKWEMKKYAYLWKAFGEKEFTNEQALKVLKEKDAHLLSVLFYDLKNMGWIEIKRDEQDKRRKIYKLKEPNQAVKEMAAK